MDAAVLRVVTSNNVDVFRLLGQSPIERMRVDYQVAADQAELLDRVRAHRPQVVLVDTELAGGSGYDACRRIKDDAALRDVHVVVLLSQPPGDRLPGAPPHRTRLSRADIDRLYECGADDVLALPIHPDDFYHHLAHLAGLPFRRDRRVRIDLELSWPGPDGVVTAQVTNAGAGGVGVISDRPLPSGEVVTTRLRQGDVVTPETRAVVAWCKPQPHLPGASSGPDPAWSAGLRWDGDPPVKTRLLLEQVALFDLEPRDEGGVAVTLHGDFTELTRFDTLLARLSGESFVEFDTASVRYLSSAGVRTWCQFLEALPAGLTYRFRHCSVAFAAQAAMVPMVLGAGEVVSLEAPYVCEACDEEDLRLLDVSAIARDGDRPVPPRLACLACGGELVFDDVPERYFAFLPA